MVNIIRRYKYFIISLFVLYLSLAPTVIVSFGSMRFLPIVSLMVFSFCGVLSWNYAKKARMGFIICFFCVYIIFNSMFTPSSYENSMVTVLRSTFWGWGYIVSYAMFNSQSITYFRFERNVMIISIVFIAVFFLGHMSNISDSAENVGDNVIFYSLMFVPWVALMNNKMKKWLILLIISLCVLISLKRSSTIIIIATLIILYYADNFRGHNLKPSTIVGALLIIVCVFGVLHLASDKVSVVSERFEALEDDGGSGRNSIFEDVYERYERGSIVQKIFGRGFDSVRRDSSYIVPVSAHNDFLEVLYDFGAIGFIFYLLIHLSLIKWTIRLLRARSQLAFPVLISYVCFLVMSMVSHLILYPTYFGLLTAFWAYAECKDNELQYQ